MHFLNCGTSIGHPTFKRHLNVYKKLNLPSKGEPPISADTMISRRHYLWFSGQETSDKSVSKVSKINSRNRWKKNTFWSSRKTFNSRTLKSWPSEEGWATHKLCNFKTVELWRQLELCTEGHTGWLLVHILSLGTFSRFWHPKQAEFKKVTFNNISSETMFFREIS